MTSTNGSPFFQVLADADEVKVREVSSIEPASSLSREKRLRLFSQAQLLAHEGEDLLARNIYSYLLQHEIRDWNALRGLGDCLLRLGETISAKKCFGALIEFRNYSSDTLRLAQCYLNEQNYEKAFESLETIKTPSALSLPEQIEYYRDFGNCAQLSGMYDLAALLYQQGLVLAPRYIPLQLALATLRLRQKLFAEAKKILDVAYVIDPNNSIILGALGYVEMEIGSLQKSAKYLTDALTMDPTNIAALLYLKHHSRKSGYLALLKHFLIEYLKKEGKDLEIRFLLAVILFKECSWRDCQRELTAILGIDPKFKKAIALREEIGLNKLLSI